MSEYQYYEFLALDRPLTEKQRAELRSISTRAEITATRFVNEYQRGDLKGDPRTMVERYFDAFLYLANWGTRQLMFRLPRGVLAAETAGLYCYTDAASVIETKDHLIVSLYADRDPDDYWAGSAGRAAPAARCPRGPPHRTGRPAASPGTASRRSSRGGGRQHRGPRRHRAGRVDRGSSGGAEGHASRPGRLR